MHCMIVGYLMVARRTQKSQTKEVRYRTSLIQLLLCNELVNKFFHIYTKANYRTKKKSSFFFDY